MSGDEPHPSASQPVKELDAELGSITVVGDNLIIHYNSFSTLANSVGGINWRTGQDVFVSTLISSLLDKCALSAYANYHQFILYIGEEP